MTTGRRRSGQGVVGWRINGLSAARQITALSPRARVVMISNYDDPELRTEASRAGATAYLRKDNLLELPALLQQHSSGYTP